MNKFTIFSTLLIFVFACHSLVAQPATSTRHTVGNSTKIILNQQNADGISLTFSLQDFQIGKSENSGEMMCSISVPGHFSPNTPGAPNLPSYGRFIAIPQGSIPKLRVRYPGIETMQIPDITPAPAIVREFGEQIIKLQKNPEIYSRNAFYPEQPVKLSKPIQIRGVNAVILEITPFQYNPVSKTLRAYRDMEIEITFEGGNDQFGNDRLRSRWWDPVLRRLLLNYASLPAPPFHPVPNSKSQDFEYIIITPDNQDFIAWADSIKKFRTLQGIRTGVVTLTEIGGNTVSQIENYIDNAYNTWTIPPAAVLLLGDYSIDPATGNGIIAPVYNNYCVSDNIFADVNGDQLPDVVVSRIPAQNANQLETMVTRILDYERTPPQNPNFYQNPLFVSGWASTGTFVMYSEVIFGFWEKIFGKQPVRQYSGYSGGAPAAWPSDTYSNSILATFGPTSLGYIPATPAYLTNWNSSAAGINSAINNGTFAVHFRGQGSEEGWSVPSYFISDLAGLNASDPPFVFSLTSLTGKFNRATDCFAEAICNNPNGALGAIAASEIVYSSVTDSYVWGLYDYLWPEFMPGGASSQENGIFPAFGNAAGKYYLFQNTWPFNPNSKEVTYHLFHDFGDAFTSLYSEVPQMLTVSHDSTLAEGQTYFTVFADSGALVSLTADDEIIGLSTASGAPQDVIIPPQSAGDTIYVTATKPNCYRYFAAAEVVDPTSLKDDAVLSPASFQLSQNYPNPFNPVTTIHYQIPKTSRVNIAIFDVLGKQVRKLADKEQNPGNYRIQWDGKNDAGQQVGGGVYFYRLKAGTKSQGNFVKTQKMMLLR